MAHDVFISYSSIDREVADRICVALESKGLRCWIAHRDITPSADWPRSIAEALNQSRSLLLLLTQNANESIQIPREVTRADQLKIPIIPVRLGPNVVLGVSLQYFLTMPQGIDAFPPPLEQHLDHLGEVIRHVLEGKPPPPRPPLNRVQRRELVVGGGAAALALLGGAWWYYGSARRPSRPSAPVAAPSVAAASPPAAAPELAGKIAVTVLPLKNLSNDPGQEYFSDGQTDAITTALAQVQGLAVVAPQSAFLLGKQNADFRTIGNLLHVGYIVDGAVQWEDHQVRVAARLTHVLDSTISWAASFDRKYTNVMALQEEVARQIAAKVQETLNLASIAAQAAPAPPPLSNEAGMEFLQARAQLRRRAMPEPGGPLTAAAGLFESVLRQSPDYFPALALLVQVYGFIPAYHTLYAPDDVAQLKKVNDKWIPKAEAAARRAIDLAPKNPVAQLAMGLAQNLRGKLIAAGDFYQQAFEGVARSTDILHLHSLFLMNVGRVREANALRQKLAALEPLVPVYFAFTADATWLSGDNEGALRMIETSLAPLAVEHPFIARQYAMIYAGMGKFREASDAVLKAAHTYDTAKVEAASRLLLAAASAPAEAAELGFFGIFNVYSRNPERALDYFEANLKAGFWPATETPQFWHPSKAYAALRATRRFRDLIARTELSDYWRERAKPDLCQGGQPESFCL